jgi:MFS family permease
MVDPARSKIKQKIYYGWIIVLTCLGINAVVHGIRYSFGVFFKSLGGEFELSRAATSGISSAYWILCALFAVSGGYLLDKYGPRKLILGTGILTAISLVTTSRSSAPWQLFLTYSLVLAAGTGAVYSVLMATAQRWFVKNRGMAVGIVGTGVGIGALIMSPLAAFLISSFGWRSTYLMMGIVLGAILVGLSFPLKKAPSDSSIPPDTAGPGSSTKIETGATDFSLSQALKTANFWLIGALWFFWAFSLMLVLTHLVPHLTDIGIAATTAALISGLIGAVNPLGRLGGGWLSDRLGRKFTSVIAILLQSGALFLLAWSQQLWMFYLFVAIFALGYGCLDPATLALIGDVFGLKKLGSIMGALMIFWVVGAGIGSEVGGIIYDASGSYFPAFLMTAILMLLSCTFALLLRKTR